MKIIDGELYVNEKDAIKAMEKRTGFFQGKRCRQHDDFMFNTYNDIIYGNII